MLKVSYFQTKRAHHTENRLTGVSGPVNASFTYDGDSNRVKTTLDGKTTVYIGGYFEWTGSTSTMKKYYQSGSDRVAVRTGSGTGTTGLVYLLGDHLGSTTVAANPDGTLNSKQLYMPWGESRYTSGSLPTDYKFTGQMQEPELGLYFYGARWFDPYLGRFLSPDSIAPSIVEGPIPNTIGYVANQNYSALVVDYHENQFLEQLNQENRIRLEDPRIALPGVPTNPLAFDRFAYTLNNPVRYNDPSGHCIWDACLVETSIVVSLIVILAVATIEATTPGRPEAFAQSVDNIGDQITSSIESFNESARANYELLNAATDAVILKISLADKLPKAGDLPYTPPKQKGNPPYVRTPDGGFKDSKGNIWTRDKSRHGGDHWDVINPKTGEHKNVTDEGKVIKE